VGEFATQVNSLSPRIKWKGIGEIVRHSYLQREVSPNEIHCRLYSNRQAIENPSALERRALISKLEDGKTPIHAITVDGHSRPCVTEKAEILMSVTAPPKGAIEVAVQYAGADGIQPGGNQLKYQLKVYLRRRLSEARDNYLSRHEGLLRLALRVKDAGRARA
ncbi:MAG TPA: hypothetical protein VFY29_05335, partial [Terriglobia bacterium]|nr:hypothetical protein [Terriglobia bacterium]